MKEKIIGIVVGIVFIVLGFLVPTLWAGFTFYVYFIPLNSTIIGWVFGIVGALSLIGSLLPSKK